MPFRIFLLLILIQPVLAEDLHDIYLSALAGDPSYQSLLDAQRAVQVSQPLALGAYLPKLSLSGERVNLKHETASATEFYYNQYSVNVTAPVLRMDLIQSWLRSKQLAQQAHLTMARAAQELMLKISQTYFDALLAQDVLRSTELELHAIETLRRQTELLFEVGSALVNDLKEAIARQSLAEAAVLEAENLVSDRREALAQLIGYMPEHLAPLSQQMTLEIPSPLDEDAWVNMALDQNLAIQIAACARDAQKKAVSAARSAHWPSVQLNASYFGTGQTSATQFGGGFHRGWQASLAGELPLFSGFTLYNHARQAKFQYAQAKDDYEVVRREVIGSTRRALRGVEISTKRITALTQALEANEVALQTAQAAYEVGYRTSVDVLEAIASFARAEKELSAARYGYILYNLQLKLAIGTLDVADLDAINGWLLPEQASAVTS